MCGRVAEVNSDRPDGVFGSDSRKTPWEIAGWLLKQRGDRMSVSELFELSILNPAHLMMPQVASQFWNSKPDIVTLRLLEHLREPCKRLH